jgi:hypothetical protein
METGSARQTSSPGIGTAGFVCGVLAVVFALVPLLNIILAPILGILGIVFGAVGMSQAGKRNAPSGLSRAGGILGVVSFVILIAELAAVFG